MMTENNDSANDGSEYTVSGCQTCPCQHELNGPCRATEHGATRNAASALPYDGFPEDRPLEETDGVIDL